MLNLNWTRTIKNGLSRKEQSDSFLVSTGVVLAKKTSSLENEVRPYLSLVRITSECVPPFYHKNTP